MVKIPKDLYLEIMRPPIAGPSADTPIHFANNRVVVEEIHTSSIDQTLRRQTVDGLGILRAYALPNAIKIRRMGDNRDLRIINPSLVAFPSQSDLELTLPARGICVFIRIAKPLLSDFETHQSWPGEDGTWGPAVIPGEDHSLLRFCDALVAESKHPGVGSSRAIESLANLLLVELMRQSPERKCTSTWVSLTPRQLRKVEEFVESELHREIPLSEMAEVLNYSPHYFCRVFKRAVGSSPHQFVLLRRVERAKGMLSGSQLDLSKIALEAGFANQSHFGTIFRKFVGTTPKRYRLASR